jgi:hypothetical protein
MILMVHKLRIRGDDLASIEVLMGNMEESIEILEGRTLSSVTRDETNDELKFRDTDGVEYVMHHHPDCCEEVRIEDITGDLDDLLNSPILRASEESNYQPQPGQQINSVYDDHYTWTFYRISTIKGSVVIRWYGTSNGYYSEEVDFHQVGDQNTYCR